MQLIWSVLNLEACIFSVLKFGLKIETLINVRSMRFNILQPSFLTWTAHALYVWPLCFILIFSDLHRGPWLIQDIRWRRVPVLVTRPLRACTGKGLHKEQLIYGADVQRNRDTRQESHWNICREPKDTYRTFGSTPLSNTGWFLTREFR